jgi:hypothetical protein
MQAVITPKGLPSVTVEALDWSFTDSEQGGWEEARFTCDLPRHTRNRLYDAEVELVTDRSVFFGHVKSWQGRQVVVDGWYRSLTKPREKVYCDTALSPWVERTFTGRDQKMSCQSEAAKLRVVLQGGTAYSSKNNGFWRIVPRVSGGVLKFHWSRPSTACKIDVVYGVWSDTDDGDEIVTQTAVNVAADGSGALSGDASVTLGDHDCVQVFISCPSGYTPGSDVSVWLSSVRYYGQSTTSITPDFVLGDIAASIPAALVPGGSDIAVDNVTTLEPFAFSIDATEWVKCERVLDYTDAIIRFEERLVGGIYRPAFVASLPPTVPAYTVDAKKAGADLVGGDTSVLASKVRVTYTDENGIARYVDVTDTDESHPLVRLGVERWVTITADTTSASAATAVGNTYLALCREQVRGTVTVIEGDPDSIKAGRLVTLTNTEWGTVTARIRQVEHSQGQAVLSLDSTPSLDDLLSARIRAATKKGSRFNAVSYIDARR